MYWNLLMIKYIGNSLIMPENEIFCSACKLGNEVKEVLKEANGLLSLISSGINFASALSQNSMNLLSLLEEGSEMSVFFDSLSQNDCPDDDDKEESTIVNCTFYALSLNTLEVIDKIFFKNIKAFTNIKESLKKGITNLHYYVEEKKLSTPKKEDFAFYDSNKLDLSESAYESADKFVIIIDVNIKDVKINALKTKDKLSMSLSNVLTKIDLSASQTMKSTFTIKNEISALIDRIHIMPELYLLKFSDMSEVKLHSALISAFIKIHGSDKFFEQVTSYFSEFIQIENELKKYISNLTNDKRMFTKKLKSRIKFYIDSVALFENKVIAKRLASKFISQSFISFCFDFNNPQEAVKKTEDKKRMTSLPSTQNKGLFFALKQIDKKSKEKVEGSIEKKKGQNEIPIIFNSVHDFIEFYLDKPELTDLILSNDDTPKLGVKYTQFLKFLENCLNEKHYFMNAKKSYSNKILEYIEKYIQLNLYKSIFPKEQSEKDLKLYNIMKELQWISPENLSIRLSNINEDSWECCIQEIKRIANEMTTFDKLECLNNAHEIVKSSIHIFGKKEDSWGYEDISIILVYCILKACPPQLSSNTNFIAQFANMIKFYPTELFSYENLKASQDFIIKIDSIIKDEKNNFNNIQNEGSNKNIIQEAIKLSSITYMRDLVRSQSINDDKD